MTKWLISALLAWRFFLLLFINENAGESSPPGTDTVEKLMESIAAREIPPALRKAKNSRQGLRDAKKYIRRHAEGVLGSSTCTVGDSTTGLGLGLFVHREVHEGEVIAEGWAHHLTPADWSRLRTSRADFSIVSTKDSLTAIPSETHRAVWLTGAACFANHLCRGANAAVCTQVAAGGKIDYVLVATRDLQPFEEVFCDYGEEYFVGCEVGCRNDC